MMEISKIGESQLIGRISRLFSDLVSPGTVGIGDDCAVIPQSPDKSWLVSTDMLLENIHFLRNKISARELGYKSLAVNLSDIAAMGGKPHSAFVSLALPADTDLAWFDAFFEGFHQLAKNHHVMLLGGDTNQSPHLIVVSVTVMGFAPPAHLKFRGSAKSGDILCVTGFLGDSGGGLRLLLNPLSLDNACISEAQALIERHHRPRPHLDEGAWLGLQSHIHAMMDVSDGLDADLRKLCFQSTQVHLEKLPLSPELRHVSNQLGWNAEELAATGGEDYCLLLAVDSAAYPGIAARFERHFGRPLYAIGEVTSQPSADILYFREGRKHQLTRSGFDHFSQS